MVVNDQDISLKIEKAILSKKNGKKKRNAGQNTTTGMPFMNVETMNVMIKEVEPSHNEG